MTISEDDVAAARRILDEHETKFGDVGMLQKKAVKSPADHPDNDRTFDDDMGYLESMAWGLEYALHFCANKLRDTTETIYDQLTRETGVDVDKINEQNKHTITVLGVIGKLIPGWT